MDIIKTLKNLFSGKTVPHIEHVVITEVQQVAAVIAPTVASDLKAVIDTLDSGTLTGIQRLDALAIATIKTVADVMHLNISKDLAIVIAQKVYTDAKAAAVAEAASIIAKLS